MDIYLFEKFLTCKIFMSVFEDKVHIVLLLQSCVYFCTNLHLEYYFFLLILFLESCLITNLMQVILSYIICLIFLLYGHSWGTCIWQILLIAAANIYIIATLLNYWIYNQPFSKKKNNNNNNNLECLHSTFRVFDCYQAFKQVSVSEYFNV